jgi:hypothetical protein
MFGLGGDHQMYSFLKGHVRYTKQRVFPLKHDKNILRTCAVGVRVKGGWEVREKMRREARVARFVWSAGR